MRLAYIGFFANLFILVFAVLGCIAESREMHWTASASFVMALCFLITAIYVKAARAYYAGGNRG